MRFLLPSAAKLNLSLRVTGRRGDGYHDILSLFWRLPSVETLSVSPGGEGDEVRVKGLEITGENIVSRALRRAREAGFGAPFLDVEIAKSLPPGSGLGAGSGNGAAVLRWLAGDPGDPKDAAAWQSAALRTGADVPFLFSGCSLALVSGVGEAVEPLEPLKHVSALVVVPDWSVGTENAYAELDRRGVCPLTPEEARAEAGALCRTLRTGGRVGFLPNDFAPGLMEKFPGYGELFTLFDGEGACAWGITGSGAAAFALFHKAPRASLSAAWPSWVRLAFCV